MRLLGRAGILAVALMALSSVASAYYHWTFFTARTGEFKPVRLRFDLNALPDGTVSFFIPRKGPAKMVDGDNYQSLARQLRRAGETWNTPFSALQVRFGGYTDQAFADVLADQVTPGIDVVFDDELPPGVLALSEPLTYTDLKYLGEKSSPGFAPILRSRLQLASDLAARGQASYSDQFFATLVHEFGHTLGLQHSMTGGAMATSVTRGTSKANPLTADDVAGISILYPTPEFAVYTGAVAGKVTAGGAAANLASVVALAADGTAVGAMTLPDGTYRIEGLAPGEYLIYAHPLPPAQQREANPAGIVPPQDLEHVPFLAAGGFETRFYPGTTDWTQAKKVKVLAGRATTGVEFSLGTRAGTAIFNLRMFAYLGAGRDKIVHAAPLPVGFRDWMALQASGILTDGQMAPGLNFAAIGGAAKLEQNTLRNFPGSDQFLLIVGDGLEATKATPVAVVMSTDSDLYVLPNAFSVVPSKHPSVDGAVAYADSQARPHAVVWGANLGPDVRFLFDGAEAIGKTLREDGAWDVEAPPASSEHVAAVEALGPDGQTAAQLLAGATPVAYKYPVRADGGQLLTPGEIVAGTDAVITIDAPFADFLDARTRVGFGTSDVVARQMWILNRNQMAVNVSVNPKAKLGNVPVTISTGLQFVTEGPALQLRPADDKQVRLFAPLVNEATGMAAASEGATMVLNTAGLPEDLTGWSLMVDDAVGALTRGEDGRIRAVVPAVAGSGARRVHLAGPNGAASPTILFQVDALPPSITGIVNSDALGLSSALFVTAGDRVTVNVKDLAVGEAPVDPGQVTVRLSGIRIRPSAVKKDETGLNKYTVEFIVPANLAAGEHQPLTVGLGTRVSATSTIGVVASETTDVPVE